VSGADASRGDEPVDSPDEHEDEAPDELREGHQEPRTTQGAPWPAGETRSDGPNDRPRFDVPTAPPEEDDDA